MIWRLFGWLTVVYLVLGSIAVVFLATTVSFLESGARADWAFVPGHAIIPLWIATSLFCLPAFLAATVPAPFGFFRHARGKTCRGLLLAYALTTLVLAAVVVGARLYLVIAGAIPTSANSQVLFTAEDVVGSLIACSMAVVPALAALVALRRPGNRRLLLTSDARNGQ